MDKTRKSQLISEFLDELEKRESAAQSRSIGSLFDEWMPHAPPSRARINDWVRKLLHRPMVLGEAETTPWDMPCGQFTREAAQAWVDALATVVGRFTQRPLVPGTRDQLRLALQSMFTWHVERGAIASNPFREVPLAEKVPRMRVGYFSDLDQMNAFLAHLPPILADMFRVSALSGGLRKNEIRLLRKDAVDHSAREIIVTRKMGKTWRVLLDDVSYEIIQKWSAVSPGEYVFANPRSPTGGPINDSTLQRWFARGRNAWGSTVLGERPVYHLSRHSYTMAQLQAGQFVGHIAEQMGLRSIKQIVDRYGAMRGPAREAYRQRMSQSQLAASSTPTGKRK